MSKRFTIIKNGRWFGIKSNNKDVYTKIESIALAKIIINYLKGEYESINADVLDKIFELEKHHTEFMIELHKLKNYFELRCKAEKIIRGANEDGKNDI